MELNDFILKFRELISCRLREEQGCCRKEMLALIERTITDVLIGLSPRQDPCWKSGRHLGETRGREAEWLQRWEEEQAKGS